MLKSPASLPLSVQILITIKLHVKYREEKMSVSRTNFFSPLSLIEIGQHGGSKIRQLIWENYLARKMRTKRIACSNPGLN